MKINNDSNTYDFGGKTMKKIITFLLTVITICLCFVGCGEPAPSPVEDFSYEFKDGEVTITGYTGTDLEIVIPEIIDERPVTVIGEKAFSEYDMTSIVLSDTVTSIEKSAFDDCENLKEVNLGKGLKNISENAFYNCKLLEKIDIPDSVTDIRSYAFCGCENLKEVNLGKELKSIATGAFINCDSLKSIHIPENVTDMYEVYFGKSTNGDFDFTIYGKSGSVAETYAKENGLNFVAE